MSRKNSYWSLTVVPFLIRQKVYLDRARNYYGYAAFPSMVLLILRSFNVPLTPRFIAIGIPAFILGSLLLGWLDKVLGLFSEEAKRHSSLNPIYDKISDEIKAVNDDVSALHLVVNIELKSLKERAETTEQIHVNQYSRLRRDLREFRDEIEKLRQAEPGDVTKWMNSVDSKLGKLINAIPR